MITIVIKYKWLKVLLLRARKNAVTKVSIISTVTKKKSRYKCTMNAIPISFFLGGGLSQGLVFYSGLGDLFVSQNLIEFCVHHSPG